MTIIENLLAVDPKEFFVLLLFKISLGIEWGGDIGESVVAVVALMTLNRLETSLAKRIQNS